MHGIIRRHDISQHFSPLLESIIGSFILQCKKLFFDLCLGKYAYARCKYIGEFPLLHFSMQILEMNHLLGGELGDLPFLLQNLLCFLPQKLKSNLNIYMINMTVNEDERF